MRKPDFRIIYIGFLVFLQYAGLSQNPAAGFQSKYLHGFGMVAGNVTFNQFVSPLDNNYSQAAPISYHIDLRNSNYDNLEKSFSLKQISGLVKRYTIYENHIVRFRIAPVKLKLRFILAQRDRYRKKRISDYSFL